MSDRELSQPPLAVYPHSLLGTTEEFFNKLSQGVVSLVTAKVDDARQLELIELADQIEKDFPHLIRGARYLRKVACPDRQREPCCKLRFVEAGPRAALGLDVQLGRPAPPPKPYKLEVTFHHRVR